MNILPKKRWHVRTKENIARIRRDETKAEEEEKERRRRIQKAETEARVQILRQQARKKYDGRSESTGTSNSSEKLEHVNFFIELEGGKVDYRKSNKNHEREKKKDQEKYEKKIGYLTYLGQDSSETTGKISWYNKMPEHLSIAGKGIEADTKRKALEDPIHDIKRYLRVPYSTTEDRKSSDKPAMIKERKRKSTDLVRENTHNIKKHKLNKSNVGSTKDTQSNSIEKLRAERLLREQTEKHRTEALLAKLRRVPTSDVLKEEPELAVRQKYNSQFFPELARQNVQKILR